MKKNISKLFNIIIGIIVIILIMTIFWSSQNSDDSFKQEKVFYADILKKYEKGDEFIVVYQEKETKTIFDYSISAKNYYKFDVGETVKWTIAPEKILGETEEIKSMKEKNSYYDGFFVTSLFGLFFIAFFYSSIRLIFDTEN